MSRTAALLTPLAFLASLALGCAPETIDDLGDGALVLVITEGGGFCSSVHAVDASGSIWRQSGCEEGSTGFVQRSRTVTETERAELEGLMDEVLALPEDGDCATPSPSARRLRFLRTGDGEGSGEIRQCEPGLPAPAVQLSDLLTTLTQPTER